jgi:hypothetical protein
MNEIRAISHDQFVQMYRSGELYVKVNGSKAGDLVMSEFGAKPYCLAHSFWTWTSIVMLIPLPIALLFVKWYLAVACFLIGAVVYQAARKSAREFVLSNMLERVDFWDYALLHGGAKMYSADDCELSSEFLERMAKKFP